MWRYFDLTEIFNNWKKSLANISGTTCCFYWMCESHSVKIVWLWYWGCSVGWWKGKGNYQRLILEFCWEDKMNCQTISRYQWVNWYVLGALTTILNSPTNTFYSPDTVLVLLSDNPPFSYPLKTTPLLLPSDLHPVTLTHSVKTVPTPWHVSK